MKRTGKIVITLVTVWLLAFTAACAPAVTEEEGVVVVEEEEVVVVEEEEVVVTEEETVAPAPAPTEEWGTIEIRVTDPPPADVKSAVVYLTNIEVHKVSDNGSEWVPIVGAPPSFDLLDVIGVAEVLGSANVTAGSFTQIRMDTDRVEVVTVDGDNITAEVPSGKLKIVRPFNVGAGTTTILTLDFDGTKSLIVTSKGKALFKPVVKLSIDYKGKIEQEEEQEREQEREKEQEADEEEEIEDEEDEETE